MWIHPSHLLLVVHEWMNLTHWPSLGFFFFYHCRHTPRNTRTHSSSWQMSTRNTFTTHERGVCSGTATPRNDHSLVSLRCACWEFILQSLSLIEWTRHTSYGEKNWIWMKMVILNSSWSFPWTKIIITIQDLNMSMNNYSLTLNGGYFTVHDDNWKCCAE